MLYSLHGDETNEQHRSNTRCNRHGVEMNKFIHVEVLDRAMNPEYIIAVPVEFADIFQYVNGYYTSVEATYVLCIPGSFIVRRRNFENEKIGVGK